MRPPAPRRRDPRPGICARAPARLGATEAPAFFRAATRPRGPTSRRRGGRWCSSGPAVAERTRTQLDSELPAPAPAAGPQPCRCCSLRWTSWQARALWAALPAATRLTSWGRRWSWASCGCGCGESWPRVRPGPGARGRAPGAIAGWPGAGRAGGGGVGPGPVRSGPAGVGYGEGRRGGERVRPTGLTAEGERGGVWGRALPCRRRGSQGRCGADLRPEGRPRQWGRRWWAGEGPQ